MIRLFFALALIVVSGTAYAEPAKKPNVIFILADDLGWTDLSCQGSKYYQTPNIDKLAAAGLRFTNGYTCGPNCQPTRAALMTGQYGPRTGVYTVGAIDRFNWQSRPLRPVDNVQKLPLERKTIGDVMKNAGYSTAMFGKWHLGQDEAHHPAKRGFDEAIVSMGKHFDFVTQPKVDYPKGTYLADFLTDKATDFIKRNKEKPFFLYLPHFGVHSPHEAKPDLLAKFQKLPTAGGHTNATYAAMIASVDESVGRVLTLLDELKLAENTVVIFSSDNGGVGGYVREGLKKSGDITDNAPLRSGKGSLYEGGVRVPWIVRWPGKIPVGTTDAPIISVDLMTTLIELAGTTAPAKQPLDGVSMVECFTSGGKKIPTRDLFWHFPGYLGAGQGSWRTTPASAIRSGNWKLIEFFETNKKELYDLKADESQKTDLAENNPEMVKELHAKLVSWRNSVNAPMPTANKKKD
jgi:arylsulfatase A-like enzyme